MSNLRIVGLIIGIFWLVLTFRVYRGQRWKRLNFLVSGSLSLFLVAICLDPDLLNSIAAVLALKKAQRGRILTILIFSNIGLWFLWIHSKTKLDEYSHQFDLLVRNFGHEDSKHMVEQEIRDKQIMVIIPAYNEERNLGELLEHMPDTIDGMKLGVLLVDDGSDDHTYDIAKQGGALVVRNRINRGQGAALRLGYDILIEYSVPIGVTMDSDGQHRFQDIEKVVRPILQDKCDLVIGSRMLGTRQTASFLRGFGIAFFTKIINVLTGTKLTDCSSGFKAFNIARMKQLELKEDQFQSGEVIIEAVKKGLRVGEAPITILSRKYGKSKKGRDLHYGFNFAKALLRSWWK